METPETGPHAGGRLRGCLFLLPALFALGVAAYVLRDGLPESTDQLPVTELALAGFLLFASLLVGFVFFLRSRATVGRAASPEGEVSPSRPVESLTGSERSRRKGRNLMRFAFGVFLLAGLGFLIPFGLMFWRLAASQTWEETRCTVLSSAVGTHSGDDGATYSVDVTYRYSWNGETFTSDRYKFTFGSSSGYDGKAAVVARYPPGSEVACWLDPSDPAESVLVRSVGWEALFVLLPLVFVAIGAAGVLGSFGAFGSGGSPKRQDWLPGTDDEEEREPMTLQAARPMQEAGTDPSVLSAQSSPKGRLVGSIVFAVFWNGFVWTFLYFLVVKGDADGCAVVFLGIFAVIGLFLLASVPYYALALANPRPILRLGGVLTPGRTIRVSWRFEGKAERIQRLTMKLAGREEARYRRGTNTYTDKHVFHETVVLELPDRGGIPSGETAITIPADAMHSFDGGNNKVIWTLAVHGDIPRWPDVNEEFELTVRPEGLGS